MVSRKESCFLAILILCTAPMLGGELRPGLDGAQQVFPTEVTQGEVTVEAVDDHVIVALDRFEGLHRGDGFVDEVLTFEAGEEVDLLSYTGFGMLRLEEAGAVLVLPAIQQTLQLTIRDRELEAPGSPGLAPTYEYTNGQGLSVWSPGTPMTPVEALDFVSSQRKLRSSAATIFQQDPGTGDPGGCARSCTKSCRDGSQCSVTCPTNKCAECDCPANCYCTTQPG